MNNYKGLTSKGTNNMKQAFEHYNNYCGAVNAVELWRFKELISTKEGLKQISDIIGKEQNKIFLSLLN